MEIYKKIVAYPEYEVSNFGNVRRVVGFVKNSDTSFRKIGGKNLSQKTKKNGYKEVHLCLSRKYNKMFYVHRLVVTEFIGEIPIKQTVNHKDGNKSNNNISNLEIMTHSENILHSFNVLKRKKPNVVGINHPRCSVTEQKVIDIRNKYNELKKENCRNLREIISKEFKVKKTTLVGILSNKTWKHLL